jgi:hypothetical protein
VGVQRSFSLEEFLSKINLSEDMITVQFDISDKERELLKKYNIKHIKVN